MNTTPYFRILVSQGDTKLFRTSRIMAAVSMIQMLGRVHAGFPSAEGFDVQVLAVSMQPDTTFPECTVKHGEILTSEQLSQMVQALQAIPVAKVAKAQAEDQQMLDPTYIAPGVYSTDSIVEDNIKPGLTD